MVDYRWRAAKTIDLIQKFNLYLTIRDSLDVLSQYLLVMEHLFDAILYSKLGNENFDTGHFKCLHGPQVAHSCSKIYINNNR